MNDVQEYVKENSEVYLRSDEYKNKIKTVFKGFATIINEVYKEYDLMGIFLRGSQNYNLHTSDSNIDAIAVIIPDIKDALIQKDWINTTICDGKLLVKDIRTFIRDLLKQNPTTLEVLCTDYKLENPLYEYDLTMLRDKNSRLIRYDKSKFVKAAYGAITSFQKRIKNDKSFKDMSAFYRMIYLVNRYIDEPNCKLEEMIKLDGEIRERLYRLKIGEGYIPTKDMIYKDMESIRVKINEYADDHLKEDLPLREELEDYIVGVIRKKLEHDENPEEFEIKDNSEDLVIKNLKVKCIPFGTDPEDDINIIEEIIKAGKIRKGIYVEENNSDKDLSWFDL